MDVFRVGVSILATNSVTPVLNLIGRQMTGLQTMAGGIGGSIGAWAVGLGAAGLATAAVVKGFEAIVKAGGGVNHQMELMKTAGMSVGEINTSMAQAMRTSNEVLTTNLSENLQHLRELRYAFGETSTAMDHLTEISKANSILSNIKGGGKDEVWELVKALESKGETYDPKEFSSYVNTMTKVVQATGGKVTPQMFMGTFKYGRTSTLGWSEDFIGGALPRLIQEYTAGGSGNGGSGGPGNALMSMYSKVVQEQMSKTAASEFERMGLGTAETIKGSSNSRLTGVPGRDLFMANPYEWVQQVLLPHLQEHGITSKEDVLQQLSKMFQVRTASDVTAKMALQGRFMEGENSPFEKDIRLQHAPMGLPAYSELMKNDAPMIMEAFNKQWTNLLETIGSPLMAPGGPVISALAGLTTTMGALAMAARPVGEALGFVSNVVGSLLTVSTAIAKFGADVTGVTGVFQGLGDLPWAKISSGLHDVSGALNDIAANVSGFFNRLGNMFGAKKPDGPEGLKQNQSYRFDPGYSRPKATPISLNLNVDGRTLAQTIADQMDELYQHPTQAPAFDESQRPIYGDSGAYAT